MRNCTGVYYDQTIGKGNSLVKTIFKVALPICALVVLAGIAVKSKFPEIKKGVYDLTEMAVRDSSRERLNQLKPYFDLYFSNKKIPTSREKLWPYAREIVSELGLDDLMQKEGWNNQSVAGALKDYIIFQSSQPSLTE